MHMHLCWGPCYAYACIAKTALACPFLFMFFWSLTYIIWIYIHFIYCVLFYSVLDYRLFFFFIFLTVLYRNNHNVQCTWFLFSLNISKQWIYLQCVVTIYTKALAHIYNCKSKCVDLFLLDQCVINLVYLCLLRLKLIGQYATYSCAHSWMIFFFTASKGCLIILFCNFLLKKCFNITNLVKVMINLLV